MSAAGYRRLVVKIGSALITNGGRGLDLSLIHISEPTRPY